MTATATKIPALRFPEFEGEWEEKRLGKDINLISGQHLSPGEYNNDEDGVPYFTGPSDFTNNANCLTKWTQKSTKIAITNDVLLTVKGSGVGSIMFLKLPEVAMGRQLMAVRAKGAIAPFLYQILSMKTQHFEKLATGNMIPGISREDIIQTKVALPTLPEQQKIATFLTIIDTRIQQLSHKKALLEQYKKGVMQEIFLQEIRFKDEEGKEFPAWEELELCEVAIRVLEKNRDNAVTFVLTNSATQGIVSQQDYFDKDIANPNNLEGYYVVQMDDFVYNPRISNAAPVGPIKRNKLAKGVMSPLYTVFRFKNHDIQFFEYFFETTQWHFYMKSVANYGIRHDRMNITNADFIKMPVPIPALEEQQKIATFLAAFDAKIDQVNQQLERMQTFKKGLLQQMFV